MTADAHTAGQISDAIEILDMCKPIRDIQGGMWFGHNQNIADATFVDYGACRAFAVAARTLPTIAQDNKRLRELLTAILAANDEFRASLPEDWEGDPLQDACDEARRALEGRGHD